MEEDIDNIFLFANGIWNGKKTTKERLERFIESYNQLKEKNLKPPGKITHIQSKKERDSQTLGVKSIPFAFGELENLRLEKTDKVHPQLKEPVYKLYGDLKKVPSKVKSWWDKKLLKGVSLEISPSVKLQDGTVVKDVIDSVALLGHETPALFEAENYGMEGQLERLEPLEVYSMYSEKEVDMTKQQYMEKVQKYGNKAVSYEKYMEMPEEKQEKYMKDMEEEYMKEGKEMTKQKFSSDSQAVSTVDSSAIIQELKAELEATRNDKQEIYSLLTELKESEQSEKARLREELESLKQSRKEEKVKREVYALTRSEAPRVPASLENDVIDLLMNASEDVKENYSITGNEGAKSVYSLALNILSKLPENKVFSEPAQVPNDKGFVPGFEQGSDAEMQAIEQYAMKKHGVADIYELESAKIEELIKEYRGG